jgi:hypothetical protein
MQTLKRIRQRHGRCYELVGRAMLDEPDADLWRLVHGTVWNDTLAVHMDHAWIALENGKVYDPVFNKYFEWRFYAASYAAAPAREYSRKEVAALMLASKHWGPWSAAPDGAAP